MTDKYQFAGKTKCGNCKRFQVIGGKIDIPVGIGVNSHLRSLSCSNCGIIGKVKEVSYG